jgi:signal transduction histidine kinase
LVRSGLRRRQAAIELLKAKDKAEEGDRLKSEFIRNLSHEIRTPLHSIIGFSDLLSADPGAQKDNATYISVIHDSVKQLMSIIRKVLEISSLESKVEKANFQDISIRDLLSDQFEIFRSQAEQKGLSYINDNKGRSQDYVISTDPHQLIRILGYLLENAIKFTDAGGEVHLGYRETNGYLIIHVRDTGVGISKEQQQIIFGRFVQGDYQLSRRYDGIGLGLAIARETARLLGGDITVDSEQGKGATFFIHLPKG